MPKSNFLRKKNKTGATADFKRLKAKVGKRAPQAASHTDTSFKSKRVRVSAQSILHDIGDVDAVTARGQGVQELLIQLRHYSPASKREALAGLKSIVDRHRAFAEVNFTRLAEASLELAVSPDNDVRKGLLAFQEALLACVSARTFSPFANLYTAYVVSAMTSLIKGVRRDSLTLLALLLARFPAAVADRAERLAPNYVALLAADPASKKHAGRADALQSLVSLFRAVSRRYGRGAASGGWGGSGSGSGLGAARLSWKRASRGNGALMLCPCAARVPMEGLGSDRGCGRGVGPTASTPQIKALASILPTVLERLREVWIEALAALPPDVELMQSVVHLLLEAIASPAWAAAEGGKGVDGDCAGFNGGGGDRAGAVVSWRDEAGYGQNHGLGVMRGGRGGGIGVSLRFSRFVPLILEAFPVRPLEGELLGDVAEERLRAIQGLNMRLCELVVAACAGPGASAGAAGGAGAATAVESSEGDDPSEWLARVLAHVHEVLRDEVGRRGAAGPQISSVLRVLSAATQNPAGKSGAFLEWTAQKQRLLSAFGDFLQSLPARSETKLLCTRFVCRLTSALLQDGSTGGGGGGVQAVGGGDAETPREVCRWLRPLPELLCRWGADFPENSAAALGALIEVAKHSIPPQHQHQQEQQAAVEVTKMAVNVGGESSHGKGGKEGWKTATAGGGQPAAATAAGARAGRGAGHWALASSELLRSIEPALLAEFFGGEGFLSLPPSAQMDAVSLLFHLPEVPAGVVSELAAACSEPAALERGTRSFVLEVMHHRRQSLSPSAYLGFLVSILTASASVKSAGGAKRAARQRTAGAGTGLGSGGDGGKRWRERPDAKGGVSRTTGGGESAAAASIAAPTLWETVFGRDEVTGAVCNALAMIGTRGGVLLEALQPTLLYLLRHESIRGASGGGGRRGDKMHVAATRQGVRGVSFVRSPGEESLAAVLQEQRAAMACVLCCWEGLDAGAESSPALPAAGGDTATNGKGNAKPAPPSPLLALEKPVAAACVWAMKTAGTTEAAQKARGPRLLRPALLLLKRWPALFPLVLADIVEAASEVTAAAAAAAAATMAAAPALAGGEGQRAAIGQNGGNIVFFGGCQALEPVLLSLQALVRDPGLQRQLRRRHAGVLRESAEALRVALEGSPLTSVVLQLRADVEVLVGGGGGGGA